WATFWVNQKEGVDLETPPTGGIFNFSATREANEDITDINLLSSRQLQAATNRSPNVEISFNGLAETIKALRNDATHPPNQAPITPAPDILRLPAVPPPRLPPRLGLADFGTQYTISAETITQLRLMKVVGPHVLRLLSKEDLLAEGLSRGQVAEVRDAEERWMKDIATVPWRCHMRVLILRFLCSHALSRT
ncbi:uncharacterized protein STEHIDRAFT_163296, partial [Stereum hirsutum FP-91666 SS1]